MLPDPAERPTITAHEAATLFSSSSDAWYDSVRRGDCPVPVLRVGRKILHPTAAVLAVLGLAPEPVG